MNDKAKRQATAVIYTRVSSVRQAEDGLPIASQLEQCRKKAAALGARIVREFADEGISGRTAEHRPEFMKAINYCQEFEVAYFIVWNSARFARNKIEAPLFKRQLRAKGTKLAYVSNDIDPHTDEGWLSESVMEMMDEFYSRSVSKDTKRSMLKNAADGFFNGGRVPYGYRVIEEGKRRRLAIDDVEAPLVRRIFRIYSEERVGYREIAIRLNRDGLTKRGEPWNKKGVGLILTNHRYAGITIFNRRNHQERMTRDRAEWITAQSHEGIIDSALFESVQEIIASRGPVAGISSPRSRWAFTGLLYCGLCGTKMKIETATGRSRTYAYYRCGATIDGKGCKGFRFSAPAVDDFLLSTVSESLFRPEGLESSVQWLNEARNDPRASIERRELRQILVRELRDLEGRREKIYEVIEAEGKGAAVLQDLLDRASKYRTRIDEIEDALAELEALDERDGQPTDPIDAEKLAKKLKDLVLELRADDPETLRGFLGYCLERIDFQPDGRMHLTYYPERVLSMDGDPGPDGPVHRKGSWLPVRRLLRTAALDLPAPPRILRQVA